MWSHVRHYCCALIILGQRGPPKRPLENQEVTTPVEKKSFFYNLRTILR